MLVLDKSLIDVTLASYSEADRKARAAARAMRVARNLAINLTIDAIRHERAFDLACSQELNVNKYIQKLNISIDKLLEEYS